MLKIKFCQQLHSQFKPSVMHVALTCYKKAPEAWLEASKSAPCLSCSYGCLAVILPTSTHTHTNPRLADSCLQTPPPTPDLPIAAFPAKQHRLEVAIAVGKGLSLTVGLHGAQKHARSLLCCSMSDSGEEVYACTYTSGFFCCQ